MAIVFLMALFFVVIIITIFVGRNGMMLCGCYAEYLYVDSNSFEESGISKISDSGYIS